MKTLLVALLTGLVLFGCGDDDGSGDYDNTCYDCNTVCGPECDDVETCMSECARVQGYSDGFMWLEAQLSDWGCEGDHLRWSSMDCP